MFNTSRRRTLAELELMMCMSDHRNGLGISGSCRSASEIEGRTQSLLSALFAGSSLGDQVEPGQI